MKKASMIIAATVGALFASASFADATPSADANTASVKCVGANACKGNSACKTAENACKGQNSCKGKGYIMTATEKECTDKGGKVEKEATK